MKQARKQATASKVVTVPTEKKEQSLTIVNNSDAQIVADEDYKVLSSQTKIGLNLEETVKLIESLHLKKRHRDRLEFYIDMLNSFEVEVKEEDLDFSGYYRGCSLTIEDDSNGKFNLKNPVLISEVVTFLHNRLSTKLTEIESEIVLPN